MAQKNSSVNKEQTSSQASTLNKSKVWNLAFLISLLVVFFLMTIMSFSYGLSGDEVDMNEYGKAILKYFTSFGENDLVFNMPKEYDRDGVILYYGGFFDLVCAIFNQFSPFEEYTTRHILNAWAGFIAIFFSAKIVNLITGKRWGTIAVWIMFLSPFFLGHAMNNPKDLPLATGYITSVYFIIRFFEKYPSVKWTDYLWVILSIGITINIRVAGILLIPYLFIYAGLQYFVQKNAKGFDLKSYLKPLVIISIGGYLAGSLFWPYGQQNPISNPLTALDVMSNFKVNLGQIWEGEKVFSGLLPKNYLIKSFFITNTFAVLVGLLFFFLFIRQAFKSNVSHIIYFVVFTALFPLFYIIYKGSNVYHAWRHVLFIFPSLVIMVSLGWSYLNSFSIKAYGKNGVGLVVGGLMLLEPLIFIISTYPNTITYHNAFAGGVAGAYGNYEVDYYYNSVKQCTDYFEEEILPTLPKDKETVVLSNAAHLVVQYIDKYDNVGVDYIRYYEKDMRDWDYAIFHIALIPLPEIQAESWVTQNAVFVAESKGKPLCALFKRNTQTALNAFRAEQSGDNIAAIDSYIEYLKTDSTDINILNHLARILIKERRVDEAYKYSLRAYKINPLDAETQRVYGMTLINKGEYIKAEHVFENILKKRPDFITAQYYLGIVNIGKGNYLKALEMLKSISKKERSLAANCYKYMAIIYGELGDVESQNKYRLLSAE